MRHRGEVEALVEQLLRELAGAVRAKVEEDRGVVLAEPRPAVEDDRLDELVRDVTLVACADGGDRILGVLAVALDDRVVGALGALPAAVAVHRVVAADDGRDPVGRELGEVLCGRVRRDVAAVGEGMNPGSLGGELEQCLEVVHVRVDAAVGHEPQQVDVAALREGGPDGRVFLERPVRDRAVDPLKVLVEHAAGADRQVADLRVAHLRRRKADRFARGFDRGVRILRPEPVEDGRVGELDRISRTGRRAAPPVQDDERD